MKKGLKILVIVVVLALVLLLVPVGIFLAIDLNNYKQTIADAVHKATGRELKLEGELSKSVFPWLGVEIGRVSFSNAAGFQPAEFARADKIQVKVALLPLFKRQIHVADIVLHGLVINLAVNKAGVSNWADLTQAPAKAAPAETKPAAPGPQAAPPTALLAALVIGGVDIRDAQLRWDDRQSGTLYEVDHFNVNTGEIRLDKPIHAALSLNARTNQVKATSHLDWKGDISVDLAAQRYHVANMNMSMTAEAEALQVKKFESNLSATVDADLQHQTAAVKNLKLNVNATLAESEALPVKKLEGSLNADVDANLQQQNAAVNNLKLNIKAEGAALPGKRIEGDLSANVDVDMQQQTAAVNNLMLSSLGIKLSGKVTSKQLMTSPTYSGRIDIAQFSPRELLKTLAVDLPPMADANVLAKASAGFGLQGGLDDIRIDNVKIALDDTTITGKAGVKHFTRPAISYALAVDKINVDRYLPPPSKATPVAPATPGTAVAASAQLPLAPLRSLDANGSLAIGHLTAAKLVMEKINTVLHAKDGQLRLHPLKAQLYNGNYSGDVKLDVRSDIPKIALDEHIVGVKVEPLLQAAADTDKLSGTVSLNAKLTAAGVAPPDIIKSLNGDADFHFNNGAVKDVDLSKMIGDAYQKVTKKTLPPSTSPGKTDFAEMKGSVTITNGIVHNQDLSVKSPALRVAGKGTVDLPRENLDYQLQVALVKTAEGQGGKEMNELSGVVIPVYVTGTFKQPKFRVDLKTVLKTEARHAIEKQKAKVQEKIEQKREQEKEKVKQQVEEKKEELRDKLKDKLKGLFGR